MRQRGKTVTAKITDVHSGHGGVKKCIDWTGSSVKMSNISVIGQLSMKGRIIEISDEQLSDACRRA
jgi:hypothetical protein